MGVTRDERRRLEERARQGDMTAVCMLDELAGRPARRVPLFTPRDDGRRYGAVDIPAEIDRRLELYDLLEADELVQHWAKKQCRKNPHFWFNHFAWTYDARRLDEGLDPEVPFVPWRYQRPVIDAVLGLGPHGRDKFGKLWPMALDKSRDLGATWLIIEAMYQDWLFNRGANYGLMTRSGSELDSKDTESLFGKLDFCLKYTLEWMKPRGFDPDEHRMRSKPPELINPETGSSIKGSMTVRNAFRSQRRKRVFGDEAPVVPDLEAVMTSLHDVTKAPLLVGTPEGRGNHFAEIIHGEAGTIVPWGSKGKGWCHLRLHYSDHPERDPKTEQGQAWLEREKARRTDEAWAQEQECSYEGSAKGRIWKYFSRKTHVFTPEQWAREAVQEFIAALPVYEAWDFGSGESLTFSAWYAVDLAGERLYALDYRCWQRTPYTDVAADVGEAGWYTADTPHGVMPDRRVGDVAGKAKQSDQRSWMANLRDPCGIKISGLTIRDGKEIRDQIAVAFRRQRILFSPECAVRHNRRLPSLVESIEQYAEDEDTGKPIKTGKKGKYSHGADTLQYAWVAAFPRVKQGLKRQD